MGAVNDSILELAEKIAWDKYQREFGRLRPNEALEVWEDASAEFQSIVESIMERTEYADQRTGRELAKVL